MVEAAQFYLIATTIGAIISAIVLRAEDQTVKVAGVGLPMALLLSGAGYYVYVQQGIQGILTNYSEGVFIGAVAAILTSVIVSGQ